MEKSKSIKAQIFYTDFIVGILIILIAILLYYGYFLNIITDNKASLNEIITDANTISSSLITSGIPKEWTNESVQRIGLTDNRMRLSDNKLIEFQEIEYNTTRKLFSTRFDFVVFFEMANETIIPVNNKCSIGRPEIVSQPVVGICAKPNISIINPYNLVKDIREGIYNKDIVRINVYVWEQRK